MFFSLAAQSIQFGEKETEVPPNYPKRLTEYNKGSLAEHKFFATSWQNIKIKRQLENCNQPWTSIEDLQNLALDVVQSFAPAKLKWPVLLIQFDTKLG